MEDARDRLASLGMLEPSLSHSVNPAKADYTGKSEVAISPRTEILPLLHENLFVKKEFIGVCFYFSLCQGYPHAKILAWRVSFFVVLL
jgi:hypothetical protein